MGNSTRHTTSIGEPAGERLTGAGAGEFAHTRREGASRQQGSWGNGERLARGLGWLSVGLGIAHVVAPRALARMIGLRGNRRSWTAMRAIGLRELAVGIGILARPRSAGWLWARVGHDMSDLALLGSTFASKRAARGRVAAATAALLGVTALDALAVTRISRGDGAPSPRARRPRATHATASITVNQPLEEVYRFWRNFENLPRFTAHLESVRVLDAHRSHWVAKSKAGVRVEWEARIVEDRPGEMIAWRSLDDIGMAASGSVRFMRAPGGRGTEVHVEMRYAPGGGLIRAAVTLLFGAGFQHLLASDLRRFKQLIETGDVVRSDASIFRGPHPAQPPSDRDRPRPAPVGRSPEMQGEAR